MAKNNFYAIETQMGKKIFETWGECEKFRNECPRGARYKGFATRPEAEAFLNIDSKDNVSPAKTPEYTYVVLSGDAPGIYTSDDFEAQNKGCPKADAVFPDIDMAERWFEARTNSGRTGTAFAYVDGSFNSKTGVYGYGVVLFSASDEADYFVFCGTGSLYSDARNVAGEVCGAIRAVKEAINLGYSSIRICYDYEGIEAWCNGRWRAQKPLTIHYRGAMDKLSKEINITFKKVAAHTGVKYNEMADGLAKQAVGI